MSPISQAGYRKGREELDAKALQRNFNDGFFAGMSDGNEWGRVYAKLRLQAQHNIEGGACIDLEKILLGRASEVLLLAKKADLQKLSDELLQSSVVDGDRGRSLT